MPWVDEKTFKKIIKDLRLDDPDVLKDSYYEDEDEWEDFKNQKPDENGLYDAGSWGICWMSEDD